MDEPEKVIKLHKLSSRFEAQMSITEQACIVLDIAHDIWAKDKLDY